MKFLRLLSLIPWSLGEFVDRVSVIVAARREFSIEVPGQYEVREVDETIRALSNALSSNCDLTMQEPDLKEVDQKVEQERIRMTVNAPFDMLHNGDSLLARLCYVAARSLRAQVIVETGVCYGVTSAYLLQAIEVNRKGCLHSIDLPPLAKNAREFVGSLVPNELRQPWTLHFGSSRRLLGPLLAQLSEIDLFVHDSLHTYENMRREFAEAWCALRAGGVLISDDVEGNSAFLELTRSSDVSFSAVLRQKDKKSLLGLAVKRL